MRSLLSWLRAHVAHLLVVAGFALPALMAGTAGPSENRVLAPAPAFSRAGLLAYPQQLDAWINDHFGWRAELIALNTRLRYRLLREFPTVQVTAGRHGRLYMAAHKTSDAPYSAITNVCGPGPVYDGIAPAAGEFNRIVDDLRGLGFRPLLMIVPSAPVIEHQDLPAWLARRCVTEQTPVAEVIASPLVTPATRAAIFYPLAEMRMWKGDSALYPKTWFHWGGSALANVVDLSVARLIGKVPPYAAPLPLKTEEMISDISHLFNGLRLTSKVSSPDYAAAGVQACFGTGCFSEFGSAAAKLKDTSRISNPNAPIKRRLVILSDSFGSHISGWYARYYGEVEQVCGNDVPQLDGAEVRRVREVLLRDPANTDLLVLYHDGSAIAKSIRRGLGPLHAPPS